MFNEEMETTLSMWRNHNHLMLLLKIIEIGLIPEGYKTWLEDTIKVEVAKYLDVYGVEGEEINV